MPVPNDESPLGIYENAMCGPEVSCHVSTTVTSTSYTSTSIHSATTTIYLTIVAAEPITATVVETQTVAITVNNCTDTSTATTDDTLTSTVIDTVIEPVYVHVTVTITTSVTSTDVATVQCVIEAPSAPIASVQGSPTIRLSNPTTIADDNIPVRDDETFNITLPFPMMIFDEVATVICVSTNGVLGLLPGVDNCLSCKNEALPSNRYPETSVFAFWDDLRVVADLGHGIYYEIVATEDTALLEVEFILGTHRTPDELYHFRLTYAVQNPYVVDVQYYNISNSGAGATVGVQGPRGQTMVWSFNEPKIESGMRLRMDTTPGNPSITDRTNV
ncbi:hypothetical protein MMC24_004039 [Lignoscripta atroalba]|nr:hypothetical protein [Lignoscripta atroalba]